MINNIQRGERGTARIGMTELVYFYCQHQEERIVEILRRSEAEGVRIRKSALPCSGKLEVSFLLKALENGAAGVALFACPEEECHYAVGSTRAKNRFRHTARILKEIGLQEDRIQRFVLEGLSQSTSLDGVSSWVEKMARRESHERAGI